MQYFTPTTKRPRPHLPGTAPTISKKTKQKKNRKKKRRNSQEVSKQVQRKSHHIMRLCSVPPTDTFWWRTLPEFTATGSDALPQLIPTVNNASRIRLLKEMERLALAANESLDEIRHRLATYKAGDLWFPAGGIAKEETDIPPVVTVLVLGFAGTGKSSLVNLMYSVLGRSGFVPFAQTSSVLPAGRDGRTLCLEEHNVLRSMRNGFCVFDSRGLDYSHLSQGLDEVSEWMEDGVRHRQLCRGSGAPETSPASLGPYSTSPSPSAAVKAAKRFARRRVNCVMAVASASELYRSMVAGDLRPVEATRELFHTPPVKTYCSENPILILTHGDELTPEERIDARIRICNYLNISETTGVYDVVCLNEHGALVDEIDPVASYSLSESIYRALLIADRSHPPKPNLKDWLLLALSWAMCCLSAFFAFLSCLCSKMAKVNGREGRLR